MACTTKFGVETDDFDNRVVIYGQLIVSGTKLSFINVL